jgi:hypothetical protein
MKNYADKCKNNTSMCAGLLHHFMSNKHGQSGAHEV